MHFLEDYLHIYQRFFEDLYIKQCKDFQNENSKLLQKKLKISSLIQKPEKDDYFLTAIARLTGHETEEDDQKFDYVKNFMIKYEENVEKLNNSVFPSC